MQGQSAYTFFKEERFTPILVQSLRISKAAPVARWPYYHIDLHSGGGFNVSAGVAGSPLNFIDAAMRNHRSNFYAFFVDKDLAAVRDLIIRPQVEALHDRISIFHGDNCEILPVLSQFIGAREKPHYAMGSIVIDPNGYHKGVPWQPLHLFCHVHPRFDVVMNLNITSYRRERALIRMQRGKWAEYRLQNISEFPAWFNRPNWMITAPCSMGGHLWVQLVGRTIRTTTPDYRSLGFYDFDSERGRRIVDCIEGSGPESPLLPDL